MSLLKSTRLQTKLIVGFVLSSLMTTLVGAFAVIELNKVNTADTVLYERATVPMKDLLRLAVGFQRIRVNLQGIVGASTNEEVQQRIATVERLRKEIDESSKAVEKTLISDEAKRVIEEYKTHRATFRQMTDKVIKLKTSGDSQAAKRAWAAVPAHRSLDMLAGKLGVAMDRAKRRQRRSDLRCL